MTVANVEGSVVSTATNPLWSCAGPLPATENVSVIVPEKMFGRAVEFEIRNELL